MAVPPPTTHRFGDRLLSQLLAAAPATVMVYRPPFPPLPTAAVIAAQARSTAGPAVHACTPLGRVPPGKTPGALAGGGAGRPPATTGGGGVALAASRQNSPSSSSSSLRSSGAIRCLAASVRASLATALRSLYSKLQLGGERHVTLVSASGKLLERWGCL